MRNALIAFRGKRTQSEMAHRYGVSQQAWSKYERGVCNPPPALMFRLANDSRVKMEILFFDAFQQPKAVKREEATAKCCQ